MHTAVNHVVSIAIQSCRSMCFITAIFACWFLCFCMYRKSGGNMGETPADEDRLLGGRSRAYTPRRQRPGGAGPWRRRPKSTPTCGRAWACRPTQVTRDGQDRFGFARGSFNRSSAFRVVGCGAAVGCGARTICLQALNRGCGPFTEGARPQLRFPRQHNDAACGSRRWTSFSNFY